MNGQLSRVQDSKPLVANNDPPETSPPIGRSFDVAWLCILSCASERRYGKRL